MDKMGNIGNMHPKHAATACIGLQRKRVVIIPGCGRINGENEPIAEIPAGTWILTFSPSLWLKSPAPTGEVTEILPCE